MAKRKEESKAQPFPRVRPEIAITPSRAKPFAVDCRELRWWPGVPEFGERAFLAFYDPPGWMLHNVMRSHTVRPARVHEMDCVEIETDDWEPETGWMLGKWTSFVRLTDDMQEWLATSRLVDGRRVLHTFLDDGFDEDLGKQPRRQEDRGRFLRQGDGSYKQRSSRRHRSAEAVGAGVFRVQIGERKFTCLRVLDVEGWLSDKGIPVEWYLTRAGRTVLCRRYNGRLWGLHEGSSFAGPPWDERFPDNNRIVIDGVTYAHWYDCLGGLACGVEDQ